MQPLLLSYGANCELGIWELERAGGPTNWLRDKAGPAAARVCCTAAGVRVLGEAECEQGLVCDAGQGLEQSAARALTRRVRALTEP